MKSPRVTAVVLTAAGLLAVAGCGPDAPEAAPAAPATSAAPEDSLHTPAPASTAGPSAVPSAEPSPVQSLTTSAPRASGPPSAAAQTPATGGTALALLATLPVKGRAPLTGYSREAYGQQWADVDRNGCDTRNDVLRRDLAEIVLKPGTRDCVVLSGSLIPDPYTGTRVDFVRGGASEIDIDHVVALADTWVSGAFGWDARKRIAVANDPANLLAVDASANRQKGAGDAATWLPRAAYRCAYVARQVAVKAKYGLWVKAAERDAITRVLAACPDQRAPEVGPLVLPPPGLGASTPSTPSAPSSPPSSSGGGTDPRFDYCTGAKAAGYGPYVSGRDPEYGWYRDADSDGVVCE